jgi:hypothetical protein
VLNLIKDAESHQYSEILLLTLGKNDKKYFTNNSIVYFFENEMIVNRTNGFWKIANGINKIEI